MTRPACAPASISVAPPFGRDIERLSKTHKSVAKLVVDALTDEVGPDPASGWPLRNWNSRVYKLRMPDTCHNQGKSNGFRLIYDWDSGAKTLVLLRLYTHADMKDIADAEILKARTGAGIR